MLKFPLPQEKRLPHQISVVSPPIHSQNPVILSRVMGSLVGLAIGDALGASVEFQPHQYLVEHPVREMMSGGTWGLEAGQWTDDTSMALCLAASLITKRRFDSYDQMVRYKWWYKHGYLSSTGQCFDIGNGTRKALEEFSRRQTYLKKRLHLQRELEVDQLPHELIKQTRFDSYCSEAGVLGNGALMRLAPVPLFFYRAPRKAVESSGRSALLTHGDEVAVDACRYYGALIVAAIAGESKENLLSERFYDTHRSWFGPKPMHNDILHVAAGSFKRPGGYKDGIRAKGHVVWSLEAVLWAFWKSRSFKDGVLSAVNLGEDTDTTAAIYGQLAGAYYGFQNIPQNWIRQLYAHSLIISIAQWIQVLGYQKSTHAKDKKDKKIKFYPPMPLQQPRLMNGMSLDQPYLAITKGVVQKSPHRKRTKSVSKNATSGTLFNTNFH